MEKRFLSYFYYAFLYEIIVFGIGFLCGTFRVVILIPLIQSAFMAVLLELPIMITSSWIVSKRYLLNNSAKLDFTSKELLVIGIIAFLLLMLCELGMTIFLFQKTFDQFIIEVFYKNEGLLGLFGQLIFGFIPYLQSKELGKKKN